VLRSLARERTDRFASMQEFGRALRAVPEFGAFESETML
jgi:hypothetical protein